MDTRKGLTINLAKKKGTPSLDVFIRWAITGGRFLVILTETIVLGAFLYRFNLDRQIVDLNDLIKQRQQIVAAVSGNEKLFRQIQDTLTQASHLNENVLVMPTQLSEVQKLAAKNNIAITLLNITPTLLHVEFTTGSLDNLKNFINDLEKRKDIKDISIDRIEDRISSAELEAEVSCNLVPLPNTLKGLAPTPISGEVAQ
jgi:hypothetical protein